jgi:hypothetical protein
MFETSMFFLYPASQNNPMFGEVSISKNNRLRFVLSVFGVAI